MWDLKMQSCTNNKVTRERRRRDEEEKEKAPSPISQYYALNDNLIERT